MTDEQFMRRALELARRGQGRVHPNPMVGCVIVKGQRVVGEGYHAAFGKDHAEVAALKQAGARARGATVYVNLEPCSHWGKTPPCVDALLRAGVRKVIAAMGDPNPLVGGNGLRRLRRGGIMIQTGLLQAEARELNRAFATWMTARRPYVTLKAAMSLDGKIATVRGESRWITGVAARAAGHRLRAETDAIAVGIGTVLADNPGLTAHGRGRDPVKVVFDSRLRLPPQAKLLRTPGRVIVFTLKNIAPAKRRALEKRGTSVFTIPPVDGGVSLKEALKVLAREGITHLLVEGGGTLHAGFLQNGLADEAVWFIAPMILGGSGAKTAVEGRGVQKLKEAWHLKDLEIEKMGTDICIRGKVKRDQ